MTTITSHLNDFIHTYYPVLVSSCSITFDFPAWIPISPRGSSFETPVVLQFVDTSPGGWNPRCTKQLSWKQIIVIWAASIVDKDDSYNKCCAAHQSIPSRKKWSSQIIIWSLFWRAAISTTSWRLVFALALSSLERPPIYGQYFCNLVNSKHQQVVARPWLHDHIWNSSNKKRLTC